MDPTLTTKEQLIKTIKEWVKIDNEIRTLQKELATRKKDKLKISADLMNIMRSNEIDCFDLNDGQIMYNRKNVKKPLTKKMLLDVLNQYFDGNLLKATEINNFILDHREETVKESIVRKINK